MLRVVILDKNTVRGQALARVCQAFPNSIMVEAFFFPRQIYNRAQVELFKNKDTQKILVSVRELYHLSGTSPSPVGSAPDSFDVSFRHYRDASIQLVTPSGAEITSAIDVWYGGDGYEKNENKKWNVYRKLSSEDNVKECFTEVAVREFFSWIYRGFPDEKDEVPSLLKPVSSIQYLTAFSILCQGYLIVHAGYEGSNKDWNDIDIEHALEQMGWRKFKGSLFKSDDIRKDEVRTRNWWDQVFSGDWTKEFEIEWDKKLYWPIPEAVNVLVMAVEGRREMPSPKEIADAYCELARRLGGQPCLPA